MYYKKQGGTVIKSIDGANIDTISILSSSRALSYLPLRQTLMLQSEALNEPLAMPILAYDPDLAQQEKMPVGNSAEQFVTIRVLQRDGKDHWLRGAKVDRVIRWVNLLSLVSNGTSSTTTTSTTTTYTTTAATTIITTTNTALLLLYCYY